MDKIQMSDTWTPTQMPNWLKQRAHLSPNHAAVLADECHWTFAELDRRARKRAGQLDQLGIREGHRVASLLQNGAHVVELLHALIYLGAVWVPLNTRLSVEELVWQLKNVRCNILICDRRYSEKSTEVHIQLPGLERVLLEYLDQTQEEQEKEVHLKEQVDLSDIHSIVYTSGTTGNPKGTMLSYGNHWWSAMGSTINLGHFPDDRWLACTPLFHVSGLSILMRSVILGITAVIHNSFDPGQINRSIKENNVSLISVVSNMLVRMLDDWGKSPYPEKLRCVLLGGGPAPQFLLERCVEQQVPVVQTYGLTETASQIVTLPPGDVMRKLGSAGKALFPSELKIKAFSRVSEANQPGEIVVRGPNVTTGYFENSEATAKTLENGWLHTGDIGYLDEDGYLYVLDRRDDLILSGGENVYPAEVENVLLTHPFVAEAGVCGVPNERWGQVPVAFVKLKNVNPLIVELETDQEKELIAFCRKRLAHYKVPTRIYGVNELPRNASGKLVRRDLLKLISLNLR